MSPKPSEEREALIKLCQACAPGNRAGMDWNRKEPWRRSPLEVAGDRAVCLGELWQEPIHPSLGVCSSLPPALASWGWAELRKMLVLGWDRGGNFKGTIPSRE